MTQIYIYYWKRLKQKQNGQNKGLHFLLHWSWSLSIRTSSSQNGFLESFCSPWASNVLLKKLPSFDVKRFTVNATLTLCQSHYSWPQVQKASWTYRILHYISDFYFIFLAGPPVIVGMSINIASIDSISEVNMVSYTLVLLTLIDCLHSLPFHFGEIVYNIEEHTEKNAVSF